MDYTLAKDLKDAGWPQDGDKPQITNYYIMRDAGMSHEDAILLSETITAPTLEELIEACGDGEMHITTFGGQYTTVQMAGLKWNGEGKTIKEAVARFWLALEGKAA